MAEDRQALDFSESPEVTFATNAFVDVPVILKYVDEVLVEVVRMPDATHTTSFTVYDDSGTKLAVVQGTQLYATAEGGRADIGLAHRGGRTVGRRGRQTLFEVERTGPAAFKLACELYASDGRLVVVHHDSLPALMHNGLPVLVSGVMMKANRFTGIPVALHIRGDGSVIIGGVG